MTTKQLFAVVFSFLIPFALAASGSGEEKEVQPYHVKVASMEIKNRIVESKVRGHVVRIDQPKEFGADDTAPTPPEYLAISLGSCVVSTIRFVAMLEKVDIRKIEAVVEGEIDFSKAMGLDTENRAGFSVLSVSVSFDSDMPVEKKKEFLDKVFQRGAAIDNLMNSTPVEYRISK